MGVVQKVLGIGLSVFFSLVGGKKVFDYNNQDANAVSLNNLDGSDMIIMYILNLFPLRSPFMLSAFCVVCSLF